MPIRERPIVPEKGTTQPHVGVPLVLVFLFLVGTPWVVQIDYGLTGLGHLQELDVLREAPTAANLKRYEDDLAENSIVAKLARPYAQWTALALAGQGNEKVLIGREGWLFHKPGLLYPAGPDFRSARAERDATDAGVKRWDPLPAILAFRDELEARGIALVVVPIPVKPQIYPERLTRLYDRSLGPPGNSGQEEFFRRLEAEGVTVLDFARTLWDAKALGEVYMPLDTHWTPSGMATFAEALAEELVRRYPRIRGERPFETRQRTVANRGDVYEMLELPPWPRRYEPREVALERVVDAGSGRPVEPDRASPVVLLGDSFTNVFSMSEMKWGDHAGLGEHLAMRLGRTLDVIAVNGGAPTSTRKTLALRESLAGKKLVVWTFATRELALSGTEWAIVPLHGGQRRAAGEVVLVADVLATSRTPRPRRELYVDALTCTRYRVVSVESGECDEAEVLAVEWVLRRNVLTRAARYRPGDRHRLRLVPFYQAIGKRPGLASVRRLDDTDSPLDPFWVVEMTKAQKP
ncbi:MAG: alginate O-acetyltransferase AlgX-related protein [Planctomycetota bacterium]